MDAGELVLMLDMGWPLKGIARHFNVDVKIIERMIVQEVRRGNYFANSPCFLGAEKA